MAGIVRRVMRDSRSRLLGGLIESVKLIAESIDQLHSRLDEAEGTIQRTQLEVNHHHLGMLSELSKHIKNSGTLVLSDKEIVTKIFSGLKMYLDPRDMAITPHLALDSIWEHRVTIAWLAVIKMHDTVLDVGSNNGYYGALAAQKTDKKSSKVILFEANPYLIPYIRKTLAVNWLNEQSIIENVAVADKEGQLTLTILKDYIGSSSVHPLEHTSTYMQHKMYLERAEAVKVKATTIDTYCHTHNIKKVDLIMMDIEGFEDKAYAGMRSMVKASPNLTFFVEFTKESYKQPKQFYEQMLKDFGNVYVIDNEGYITRPKHSDYQAVIGDCDDWVMPIFSKNAKLANR